MGMRVETICAGFPPDQVFGWYKEWCGSGAESKKLVVMPYVKARMAIQKALSKKIAKGVEDAG